MEIRITKDYGNELIQNIFVEETQASIGIGSELEILIQKAKEKVCYVYDKEPQSDIERLINETSPDVNFYVIAPKIDTKIFKNCIVREVFNIKGNYIIIDNSYVAFFDNKLNGVIFDNEEIVTKVSQIFTKEYWEYATEECICGEKMPIVDRTFDIPPVYSSKEHVKVDEALNALSSQIESANESAIVGSGIKNPEAPIYLKSIQSNKDFLKSTQNKSVYYCPSLPFSATKTETDWYLYNFSICEYENLPEKQKNRLFSVRLNSPVLGETFKYYRNKQIAELVDKKIRSIEDEELIVASEHTEKKRIPLDLREKDIFYKLSPEEQEELLSRSKDFFSYKGYYKSVHFDVDIVLKTKKFTKKANIYNEYEMFENEVQKEVQNLQGFVKKSIEMHSKNEKQVKHYKSFVAELEALKKVGSLTTVTGCSSIKSKISSIRERISTPPSSKDDSLKEVLPSKKQKQQILQLPHQIQPQMPKMDMPKFGTLYWDGNDKYEYVLNAESELKNAIAEMGKKKVLYLLG